MSGGIGSAAMPDPCDHIWLVPEMAFFYGMEHRIFDGRCKHCDLSRSITGAEWQLMRLLYGQSEGWDPK